MSSGSRSRTEVAERLRAVLLDPEAAAALDVHGRINSAVLCPPYLSDGDLYAVFTRRRDDLRRHAGEISFPGGREDPQDGDLSITALREAEEEIGLSRTGVTLLGELPATPTIARVCTVVAASPVHNPAPAPARCWCPVSGAGPATSTGSSIRIQPSGLRSSRTTWLRVTGAGCTGSGSTPSTPAMSWCGSSPVR